MEPHAVPQGFDLFHMERNIVFIYFVIQENTPIDTGVCNTVL